VISKENREYYNLRQIRQSELKKPEVLPECYRSVTNVQFAAAGNFWDTIAKKGDSFSWYEYSWRLMLMKTCMKEMSTCPTML
jgi:hypothetical protein